MSLKIQNKVLKRAPVTEDFVTITRSDGERFFIEVKSDGGKHSHKEVSKFTPINDMVINDLNRIDT